MGWETSGIIDNKTMANILESTTELDLVRAAQGGNSSAFGSLYDAYIRKIYDFIYYKTLHRDTAEDIASEVFMKAWKNIARFENGSFAAWLYAIARNAVTDYYRRHKNLIDIEDCWDLTKDSDPIQELDDNLQIGAIREAMRELKSRDREIIMMRLWLDLPFKEIAERLGLQEGAVKMAFSRAITCLKSKVPLLTLIAIWPSLLSIPGK